MECAVGYSDSENEYDQSELEVALYSHIHFDSKNDNEIPLDFNSSCQRTSQLFTIGVKEQLSRVASSLNNRPACDDFNAFSKDNDCESVRDVNSRGSLFQPTLIGKIANVPRKDNSTTVDFINLKTEDFIELETGNLIEKKAPQRNDRLEFDVFIKKEKSRCSLSESVKSAAGMTRVKTRVLIDDRDVRESCSYDSSKVKEVQPDGKSSLKENSKNSTPKKTTSVKENSKISTPKKTTLVKENSNNTAQKETTSLKENSKNATPKKTTSLKDNSKNATPKKTTSLKDNSKHATPKETTSLKENSKHATPKETTSLKENSKIATPRGNTTAATDKFNQQETVLPFTITKAPKKPKSAHCENFLPEKSNKEKSPESVEKKTLSQPKMKNLIKLESFLQLPNSQTDYLAKNKKKKVSLSKTEAAVKPRKPAVLLRRPPAVTVKYHQDSDTNTEYSDSDTSLNSTSPMKKKLNSLKDSAHTMSTPQTNLVNKTASVINITCKRTEAGLTVKFVKPTINHSPDTNQLSATSQAPTASKILAPNQAPVLYPEKFQDIVIGVTQETGASSVTNVNINSSKSEDDSSETDKKFQTDDDENSETEDDTNSEEGSTFEEDQEESTSDDSLSSDPEDFLTETIQGLEFNLDQGVETNANISESYGDKWKIDDKDRLHIISTLNRYFVPKVIECRNCKVEGHMSHDCPQPLKRRCIFCATEGHSYQACPDSICFNCNTPGHKFTDCKKKKKSWGIECGRCWMAGHEDEVCPDRWRQYHITIKSDGYRLEKDNVRNPLVFCYNCGKKGHLGFECRLPRMNKFLIATYPFIAHYDTKKKCKEISQGKKYVDKSRKSRREMDEHSHQLKDKKIRQRDRQSNSLREEDTNASKKKCKKLDKDKEIVCEERKGLRERKKKKLKYKPAGSQRGHKMGELNSSSITFHENLSKLPSSGQKRKLPDNDILTDYDNHQVKNNEWWERDNKKRRIQTFSPNVTGNDPMVNKEKFRTNMYNSTPKSFYRNQVNRSHTFRGESYNDKHQQMFEDQHRHGFTGFRHTNNQELNFRKSEIRPQGDRHRGNFSNYMHNRKMDSFHNNTSKQTQLRHAGSWPSFQRSQSHSIPNRNGFLARNDRFVAMKRNCDISINIRK